MTRPPVNMRGSSSTGSKDTVAAAASYVPDCATSRCGDVSPVHINVTVVPEDTDGEDATKWSCNVNKFDRHIYSTESLTWKV